LFVIDSTPALEEQEEVRWIGDSRASWNLSRSGKSRLPELGPINAPVVSSQLKPSPTSQAIVKSYKNSSADEIANVNFYAVRPEGTRIG